MLVSKVTSPLLASHSEKGDDGTLYYDVFLLWQQK